MEILKKRFEDKFTPDPNTGCWLWIASHFSSGYGAFKIAKKARRAHRVSWELANGEIPEGVLVCHKCDIRSCVNPEHLFLGTNADNTRDMQEKGRIPTAKLTGEQVLEIRDLRSKGFLLKELALIFGVSKPLVCNIINNKRWKHV